MNCREFDNLLNELATDRLTDAIARKRALVHAGACEQCAASLSAQRVLTTELLEFASETGRQHAPLRVKENLLAALVEGQARPIQTSANVLAFRQPRQTAQWARSALAAAAMIFVALALATLYGRRPAAPAPAQLVASTPATTIAPPSTWPAVETLMPRAMPRAPRRQRAPEPVLAEQEIASDFVPLTLATDERALTNGMLVRLEVSRASLIALGLPLRVEGDSETLNAEVMLGDNGVAYAIRLVR